MGYELDIKLMAEALNALVSQAVLEGVLHGRDGKVINSQALKDRTSEVLRIMVAELAESAW